MLEANSKRANEKMKKQGAKREEGEEKINEMHIKCLSSHFSTLDNYSY